MSPTSRGADVIELVPQPPPRRASTPPASSAAEADVPHGVPRVRPRRHVRRAAAHRVRPARRRATRCTSTTPAAGCTPPARSTPTPSCCARSVLGNPHSNNPTSLATTALVERTRRHGAASSSTPRPTSTCASSPPTPAPPCGSSASPTRSSRAARSPSRSTTTTRSTASASSPAARAPPSPTCPSSRPSSASTGRR